MLSRFYSIVFYPFSLSLLAISFLVLIVPVSLLIWPFQWQIRLRCTAPFWRLFGLCTINFVCVCKPEIIDRRNSFIKSQNIPPGLYVANHQSFVDVPFLLKSFQVPPIMKKEILYMPIFGLCAYSAGAMVVNRKNTNSRKRTFEQARERLTTHYRNLQYYPEGTRQRGEKPPASLKKIKKTLMIFAYNNNIPVYPVSIYGTRNVLNAIAMIKYKTPIAKVMHDAVSPVDFENENVFCEAIWSKVCEGYKELEEKLS